MSDQRTVVHLPPARVACRLAFIYLLLSSLWIYLSDQLLMRLVQNPGPMTGWQTAKGWGFVLVSTGLIFILTRRILQASKNAREDLRKSVDLYRQMFDANPLPMWMIDLETQQFLAVNDAAVAKYGYRRDEFLGMSLADLYPSESLSGSAGNSSRPDADIDEVGVWQHRKKTGATLLVKVTSHAIDLDNRPARLMLADDITLRKRAEDALTERDTFIRAVLDNLPIGIAVNSLVPEVKFDYMNDRFPQLYRTTREALNNPDHFWEAVYEDPEFRERIRKQVLDDCASGDPERMYWEDIPITRQGAATTFITAQNIPLTDKWLMISAVWDVTERKRAEAERERLLSAIEQTSEMIVITDLAGDICYVNPAFERITGYSRKEVIGKNPRILKSGKQDEAFYQQMWNTLTNGKIFQARMVNKSKDGTLFTEAATISPTRDAENRVVSYVAVKRDITEHLQLEAHYRQAQKLESIGRLAGGVAHDYNNMLSVIIGNAEMAMRKVDPKDPLFADLREIMKAADRSAAVTRQLLTFARKQPIHLQLLDLNETVENMLSMLQRLIGEDINLIWKPGKLDWLVKMDPSQLDQMLANICINARDAINGIGRVTIETGQTTLTADDCADHPGFSPGSFVFLSVSDDGCGMDEKTLENIFEPFFTTKDASSGTGLGLAMVYGIVKQNNGFINVYSEPGYGTSLKVYLTAQAGESVKITRDNTENLPLGRGETILLVDDDSMVMSLGQKMLEDLGYQVLAANTPGEAIGLAGGYTKQIHLLVTDVVMPEMNGRELARHLRKFYPDLKILYMSGYTTNVIAHRGVLEDGVNFLQKPFFHLDLARQVRIALDGSA